MAEKSRSLNFFLLICALFGAAWFYGCNGGTSSDPIPVRILQISGNVESAVPLTNMVYEGNLLPGLRAQYDGAGVLVHLESDESKSTTADSSGNFVLSNLPAGTHRIVARIKTLSGRTFKVRSAPISVSESNPEAVLPQLDLKLADISVSGIIRKADGTPFANARLTLWGESFLTDSNGLFTTPPMVEDTAEQVIIANSGYQTTVLNLNFVLNAPLVEQIVVTNSATNRAPSVTLSANKYQVDKLYDVTLRAVATDPDSNQLSYAWTATTGTFGSDVASGTERTWTAPNSDTIATVTLTVTDPAGLKAAASVLVKVGKGVVVPNNPPIISSIDAFPTDFAGGRRYQLTANATDSDRDTLTYNWVASSTASAGILLTRNTSSVTWQAPEVGAGTTTSVTLTVTVNDRKENGLVSRSRTIVVNPTQPNGNPVVSINVPAGTMVSNVKYVLSASATDPENDTLTYAWTAAKGTIYDPSGTQTEWLTPVLTATESILITLKVTDSRGGQTIVTRNLSVSPDPNIVAPTAVIASPLNNSLHLANSNISFFGVATDSAGNSVLGSRMTWTEVESGQSAVIINTGNSNFSRTYSKPATYTVELKVLDRFNVPGYDTVTFRINATPTATITAPANKSISQLGAAITFTATGADTEDGSIASGKFAWKFPDPVGPKTGSTQVVSTLPAGTSTIELVTYDVINAVSATASIQVFVNHPPELSNISPAPGTAYLQGAMVSFSVNAVDSEGAVPAGNISWRKGATLLGLGSTMQISSLTVGLNTITITASDTMGGVTATTTTVFINEPPVMTITSPANGGSVELNEPISFKGSAADTAGSVDINTFKWDDYSFKRVATTTRNTGLDEFDFAGYNSTSDFGSHTIILYGTDQHGAIGSTSVEIFVNSIPRVTITSPASGTRFDTTNDVTVVAKVSEDDPTDSLSIRWYEGSAPATTLHSETGVTSDADGETFSFSPTTLASGSHNIFCEVTDMHGLQAVASIGVFINTLPVSQTGGITISTTQYATAPGNIPVFLSTSPSMTISFAVDDFDYELNGSIDAYKSENIKWESDRGVFGPNSTGATISQAFPIGYNEVTVRLYDTFYPEFEHQASATYKIPFYVWQSKSFSAPTIPLKTVGLHGEGDALYLASNNDPAVFKYQYTGGSAINPYIEQLSTDTCYLNATDPLDIVFSNSFMEDDKVIALGQESGTDYLVRFEDTTTPVRHTFAEMIGATSIACNSGDETIAYLTVGNTLKQFNPKLWAQEGDTVSTVFGLAFNSLSRVRYASLAPDYTSRVMVADTGNNRVIRFLTDSLGDPRVVTASSPIDMAATQKRLITLSNTESQVSLHDVSDTASTLLMAFGGATITGEAGKFRNPIAVYFYNKDLFILEAGDAGTGAGMRLQLIRSGEDNWLK